VKQRVFLLLAAAGALAAVSSDAASARRKFEAIEAGRLPPGSRVDLSMRELNAWVAEALPDGVRDARLTVTSPGVATGTALIDFGRLRRAQGYSPGWLMSKLLDGERPVSVTARIQSGGGTAKVDVERVQVSAIELDGRTLDFVIQNFLMPMYPNAAVSRPFELGYRIQSLDVRPGTVGVLIGR
jgi:hypothetical protein